MADSSRRESRGFPNRPGSGSCLDSPRWARGFDSGGGDERVRLIHVSSLSNAAAGNAAVHDVVSGSSPHQAAALRSALRPHFRVGSGWLVSLHAKIEG